MSNLLLIETSSINCSVAVCNEEKILSLVEKQELNIHASANLTLNQIDAVAVGKGPGSYTGLRIGVSTAKGICYALNKPLIACNSLKSLFEQAKSIANNTSAIYIPLIDARRMEVYTCQFDFDGKQLNDIDAVIIDENTFATEISENKILLFGDGAEKTKEYFQSSANTAYIDKLYPSAKFMHTEAIENFQKNKFEDVAYFEPFYLKEFYFNK